MVFTGVKVYGDVSMADDSKKTTHQERTIMLEYILLNVQHCTVITTAEEIDDIGLSKAIKKSLETIIEYFPNEKYLYDGSNKFNCNCETLETLVKADALVKGVGAASIIAKTTKDKLMLEHHQEFPMYGWDSNQGYVTKKHVSAILEYGHTKYHRKTYKIKEIEEKKSIETTDLLF